MIARAQHRYTSVEDVLGNIGNILTEARRARGGTTLEDLRGPPPRPPPPLRPPPKPRPGAILFTASEVANDLGVGVSEAKRLMQTEIPHVWVDSKMRVDADVLDAFKARRPHLVNRSIVYFIEATGTGCVKIGWTTRPLAGRVAQIQHASPFDVTALATMPGGLAEERALHARFAHLRMRGEWFRKEGALATLILDVARAQV